MLASLDLTHTAIALYAATTADTDFTTLTPAQIHRLIQDGVDAIGLSRLHYLAETRIAINLQLLNDAIGPQEYQRRLRGLWPDDDRLQHCDTAAFRHLSTPHTA